MPKDIGLLYCEYDFYAGTKREFPTVEDFAKALALHLDTFSVDVDEAVFHYMPRVGEIYLRWCVGKCSYDFLTDSRAKRGHWECEYKPGRGRMPAWGIAL